MELIIAVIGVLFYSIVIAGGKSSRSAYDRSSSARCDKKKARTDRWLSKVFNVTKTHECWEYTRDHYSEIPRMLAGTYAKLPSYSDMTVDEIERYIRSYRKINKDCRRRVEWNFQAWYMASKCGLVECSCDIPLETFSVAYTEREKRAWDRKYEFVMMLLREIRKTAPETRVVFTPPHYTVRADWVYDGERDIDRFRYQSGELHYMQLTWINEDLTQI